MQTSHFAAVLACLPMPSFDPTGARPCVRSSRCNSLWKVALLTRIAGCSSTNRLTRAPQLATTLRRPPWIGSCQHAGCTGSNGAGLLMLPDEGR